MVVSLAIKYSVVLTDGPPAPGQDKTWMVVNSRGMLCGIQIKIIINTQSSYLSTGPLDRVIGAFRYNQSNERELPEMSYH